MSHIIFFSHQRQLLSHTFNFCDSRNINRLIHLISLPITLLTNAVFIPLPHDTVKQLIESKYYFCSKSVKFIPLEKACDGKEDCSGAEDESSCVMKFGANSTFPRKSHTHTPTPTYLLTDMRAVSTDKTCVSCFRINKTDPSTSPSFLSDIS